MPPEKKGPTYRGAYKGIRENDPHKGNRETYYIGIISLILF